MVSEIGELHGLHQKVYQGHDFNDEHAKKELGDAMWFIAEYCTAHGWDLGDIGQMNIEKLMARYPDGFSEDKSLHRAEGDV
jgi:NTP pyrophosphatase (non-canonical NTP hydrolase)